MYRFAMRIAVFAALAAALVLASVTTASADTTSEHQFVTNITFNACSNNEAVVLPGVLHIITQQQPDGSTVVRINGQFTGTGSLGNEYVVNYRRVDTFQGGSFVIVETVLAVSKGSAPNQLLTTTLSFPPFSFTTETVCHG